jgi:extracellular factor (EF) 3-hydroxypalmitic acid methyl ester biosynthesis protein
MVKDQRAEMREFLAVLQRTKNRLEYVTANDWALILDKATRRSFAPGEPLIQLHKKNPNIIFVAKGSASIVSSRGWQIASVCAGEILGEMAFLEGTKPSATVVADEAVDAYSISWTTMNELFNLYPHLGSRFYRSVAVSLSRRLRQQISE